MALGNLLSSLSQHRLRNRVNSTPYVEVRGNRYSAPGELCGTMVEVRIGLDGTLTIHDGGGQVVAHHRRKPAADGWALIPGHHRALWQQALEVERRDLAVYEEVTRWS
jgi:hypothetical protein